jgi:hypothetical protein
LAVVSLVLGCSHEGKGRFRHLVLAQQLGL